jgi:lipopolysaccharide/colanic/teichoic acid biosynthesis glycosyltransferase
MKRLDRLIYDLVDFILAVILSGITFPLFLLVAVLVKIDSRGPLFYKQERYGKDKRRFFLYKFRTMEQGAENGRPVWGDEDDPRSSRIGRFLRISHLDEIPQLFNVLKGEMSLIGPRPERPYFAEKFKYEIADYEERYNVKPGITGWSQINGFRGNTCLIERTRLDRFYIENRSLFFNFKIFLLTPFARSINGNGNGSHSFIFSQSQNPN